MSTVARSNKVPHFSLSYFMFDLAEEVKNDSTGAKNNLFVENAYHI